MASAPIIAFVCGAAISAAKLDDESLAALKNAYEANRSTFQFGHATFEFSVGRAASFEKAMHGDWSTRYVAEGLYAFDGTDVRYEVVFPVEAMVADRQKVASNQYVSGATRSIRLLTNGEVTLWDQMWVGEDDRTLTHMAQIHAGSETFFDPVLVFPLNLGVAKPSDYDFAQDAELATSGAFGWRLDTIEFGVRLDGIQTAHVTFRAAEFQRQYWLDLERGAVPLQIVDTAEGAPASIHIRHGDIRQIGNAWTPFRWSIFFGGRAKELVVKSAGFEQRPEKDVFRLEFPRPSHVLDAVRSCLYPPEQTLFDLRNLPKVGPGGAKAITIRHEAAGSVSLPGERVPRRWWRVASVVVGVAMLLVAILMTWRHYRRA